MDSLRDDVRSLPGSDVQPAGSDPGFHHVPRPRPTERHLSGLRPGPIQIYTPNLPKKLGARQFKAVGPLSRVRLPYQGNMNHTLRLPSCDYHTARWVAGGARRRVVGAEALGPGGSTPPPRKEGICQMIYRLGPIYDYTDMYPFKEFSSVQQYTSL